ncbi:MAG TPA: tRNA dihydrouridine synthase DusB [Chthoniobacterales bacterium]|jgi:tRNA-dihydrouridine synthase B|nr:tRNA dihydrouridine synthase DusB [Chthoniobacterales bacterium]
MSLPWFQNRFPLYLAPMAGVSDKIFRQLCKQYGADVLTTEFVSAEGIFRRNERTREYLDFDEIERPVGVQLFGANAEHMAEAAKQVVDWVQPDFVDLNFGCPVNKVVCKNGGSALLKDCPTLANVASAVVHAIAPLPTTAKIRIGWDADSVNAPQVAKILADAGIAALTVHGRTRAQGYSGAADWNVIGEVATAVSIPVIGNGDLGSANDVAKRRAETGIAGAMIGRAAMSTPWIFRDTKAYFATGEIVDPPTLDERWKLILRHCELMVSEWGAEEPAIRSMRARLMTYSKSMPEAKRLREKFSQVSTLADVKRIAEENIFSTKQERRGNQNSNSCSPDFLIHL